MPWHKLSGQACAAVVGFGGIGRREPCVSKIICPFSFAVLPQCFHDGAAWKHKK